ncbi:hypothetical protein OAV88_01315 [bacterium]|nr:hypothetical protein [bacterium]
MILKQHTHTHTLPHRNAAKLDGAVFVISFFHTMVFKFVPKPAEPPRIVSMRFVAYGVTLAIPFLMVAISTTLPSLLFAPLFISCVFVTLGWGFRVLKTRRQINRWLFSTASYVYILLSIRSQSQHSHIYICITSQIHDIYCVSILFPTTTNISRLGMASKNRTRAVRSKGWRR